MGTAVLAIGSRSRQSFSIMCNLRIHLLVLVVIMAATASMGYSRRVHFTSSEYAVPVRYPVGYPGAYHVGHPNDNLSLGKSIPFEEHIRSLSKRSPVTPFKPFNPFIAKATLGLSIPVAVPFNKKTCKFTFCKNKKFGLVL